MGVPARGDLLGGLSGTCSGACWGPAWGTYSGDLLWGQLGGPARGTCSAACRGPAWGEPARGCLIGETCSVACQGPARGPARGTCSVAFWGPARGAARGPARRPVGDQLGGPARGGPARGTSSGTCSAARRGPHTPRALWGVQGVQSLALLGPAPLCRRPQEARQPAGAPARAASGVPSWPPASAPLLRGCRRPPAPLSSEPKQVLGARRGASGGSCGRAARGPGRWGRVWLRPPAPSPGTGPRPPARCCFEGCGVGASRRARIRGAPALPCVWERSAWES